MPLTLMKGVEAVELFYNSEHFSRVNALPGWIKGTLFGEGGIHVQDGVEHQHRKKFFMSLMSNEGQEKVSQIFEDRWTDRLEIWRARGQIRLISEMIELLCETACEWTELPLGQNEWKTFATDLWSTLEGPAYFGVKHIKGRLARKRLEARVCELIIDLREGRSSAQQGSATYEFAFAKHADGSDFDPHTASVDLINCIRPVVAVAPFITFCALSLHRHPEWIEKLEEDGEEWSAPFSNEVRRFYPFVPFLAARVRKDFEWKGHLFKKDTTALIDVYGLHHDSTIWDKPELFRPERFLIHPPGQYQFIPQGGGDASRTHRCPGEGITVSIMNKALSLLINSLNYSVPPQNLSIDFKAFPPAPKSGFVIEDIIPKRKIPISPDSSLLDRSHNVF